MTRLQVTFSGFLSEHYYPEIVWYLALRDGLWIVYGVEITL